MELTDGIVTLRRPSADDVDWITAACRDSENRRWLSSLPDPYGREDAEWWIGACERSWDEGTAAPFLIVDAASGERLGAIELRLHSEGTPNVGYWAAPEGRGRGAVTRALELVVRYAFDHGADRVELFTQLDNIRSQRVAERAGFVREGIERERIEFLRDRSRRDAYRFAISDSGAVRAGPRAAGG